MRKLIIAALYAASIFAANFLIQHVGMPIPGGTHLVPVLPALPIVGALMAPSGTFAAAITLVTRDLAQRIGGRTFSLAIIVPGIILSAFLSPTLAIASGAAFALGELADYFVYSPLQRKRLTLAVFASVLVGSAVDSVTFLHLAGIPLAVALPGLLVGKVEVAVVSLPVMRALRGSKWLSGK